MSHIEKKQSKSSSTFYALIFPTKVLFCQKSFHQSQNITREKLPEALLYKKSARKMMMILAPTGTKAAQKLLMEFYKTQSTVKLLK